MKPLSFTLAIGTVSCVGTLYIVATPLGNLQDITLRAIEILKQVDLVACEDTRRSLQLLNALEIKKPLLSCHGHNEAAAAVKIRNLLAEGKNIAYISDAGTPGMSDPGARLVRVAREAGFPIVPIPGPSAFSTLVSIAGLSHTAVLFEGFLSVKGAKRRSRLQELLNRGEPFVVYESIHRIEKLLKELIELEPGRHILIGREMTKLFEEYLEGTPQTVLDRLIERPETRKGEFTILVYSGKKS